MFEKDAEKILNKHCNCEFISECIEGIRIRCFDYEEKKKILLEGIKCGFNKANEWHYTKDKLPELGKRVLLKLDCEEKYEVGYLNAGYTKPLWCTTEGEEICVKVIKWKDIKG